MNKHYFVTTSDPVRRATWMRIFDTDVLPIKSPHPALSPCLDMAYRLDTHRLSVNVRTRLVGWLVMFRRLDYDEARTMVQEGYPIRAEGCHVVEQESCTPAFLFPVRSWHQPRWPGKAGKVPQNAHKTSQTLRRSRLPSVGA